MIGADKTSSKFPLPTISLKQNDNQLLDVWIYL